MQYLAFYVDTLGFATAVKEYVLSVLCVDSAPRVVEALEFLLQRLKPLTGFAEFAFGGQPLIVRQIARRFADERFLINGSTHDRWRRCRGGWIRCARRG